MDLNYESNIRNEFYMPQLVTIEVPFINKLNDRPALPLPDVVVI